mmetsp:Transcript_53100/g.62027  ORF Transcript_53100/g.62027 Transcript_53100/m.62027 type:complete len:96 (-) Transcript_53100:167-454(-)
MQLRERANFYTVQFWSCKALSVADWNPENPKARNEANIWTTHKIKRPAKREGMRPRKCPAHTTQLPLLLKNNKNNQACPSVCAVRYKQPGKRVLP